MVIVKQYRPNRDDFWVHSCGCHRIEQNQVFLSYSKSSAKEFDDEAAVKQWFKDNKLYFGKEYSIEEKITKPKQKG